MEVVQIILRVESHSIERIKYIARLYSRTLGTQDLMQVPMFALDRL